MPTFAFQTTLGSVEGKDDGTASEERPLYCGPRQCGQSAAMALLASEMRTNMPKCCISGSGLSLRRLGELAETAELVVTLLEKLIHGQLVEFSKSIQHRVL